MLDTICTEAGLNWTTNHSINENVADVARYFQFLTRFLRKNGLKITWNLVIIDSMHIEHGRFATTSNIFLINTFL